MTGTYNPYMYTSPSRNVRLLLSYLSKAIHLFFHSVSRSHSYLSTDSAIPELFYSLAKSLLYRIYFNTYFTLAIQ